MRRLTKEQFIERVSKIHPNLDFSNFIFQNTRTKGIVIDELGIEYSFTANCLLLGKRPKSKSAIDKQEWFLINAKNIHGDYYDYSKTVYKNVNTKVCIICPKHGEFHTKPLGHIHLKHKCKKCSVPKNINHPGGYSGKYKNEPGYELYLYKIKLYNEKEIFYKVGLSNNPEKRFRMFPYKIEVLSIEKGKLGDLFLQEQQIINNLKDFEYMPKIHFKGYSECFTKMI